MFFCYKFLSTDKVNILLLEQKQPVKTFFIKQKEKISKTLSDCVWINLRLPEQKYTSDTVQAPARYVLILQPDWR